MSGFLRAIRIARWLPWCIVLGGLGATTLLWHTLRTQGNLHTQRAVLAEVQAVEHELRTWVQAQCHYLEKMADQWAQHGPPDRAFWEDDVRMQMKFVRGLDAVIWFDEDTKPQWSLSSRNERQIAKKLLGDVHEARSIAKASSEGHFTTAKVPLSDELRSRFVVNYPIRGGGTIVGVFRIDRLLSTVLTDNAPDLIIQLQEDEKPVYQNVPGQLLADRFMVSHSLSVFGNSWSLVAGPTRVFLEREHSSAVDLTLVIGAGLSVLLAVVAGLTIRTHNSKLALQEKKDELAHFQSIVSNCQDAIISTAKDGTITSWNASASLLFGYTEKEMIGRHISTIDPPERDPREDELFQKVCSGEWVDPFDAIRQRKDGQLIHVSLNESPVTNCQGEIVGVSNISRDISERIRDQKALAHLSSIVASSQDAIISTTKTGEIVSCNASAEHLFGYREEEVVGRNIAVLNPPDRNQEEEKLFCKVCQGDWVDPFDTVRSNKNGELIHISLNESPISCEGEIVGVSHAYRDITDRIKVQKQIEENAELLRQANDSLNKSYEQAEAATRAKSAFLANMSHEIRTPMTAILGFSDVLADRSDLDVEMHDAVDTIKRNGEYLLQLINDILDLSKIEADKMEVEEIATNPVQIVRDVSKLMTVRAKAKGLNLDVGFNSKLPDTIPSDPVRLKQVLVNLVGNAVKFTETGRVRIDVEFHRGERQLVFAIRDEGIGMSDEQVGRLFKPFTQADTTTTRRFGGTGLGLTISRRLVRLLGGQIKVDSTLDLGSTFRVVLQLDESADFRLVDPAQEVEIVKRKAKSQLPKLDCNILLAEDGVDNQRLISFLLKKAGARVTIVENGKAAVEKAIGSIRKRRSGDPTTPFDVILMDMQMPIMDGYAASTQLREMNYDRPIIALTANAMTGDREKCLDAGCTDYATKPIDREVLIPMIDRYSRCTHLQACTRENAEGPAETTV